MFRRLTETGSGTQRPSGRPSAQPPNEPSGEEMQKGEEAKSLHGSWHDRLGLWRRGVDRRESCEADEKHGTPKDENAAQEADPVAATLLMAPAQAQASDQDSEGRQDRC